MYEFGYWVILFAAILYLAKEARAYAGRFAEALVQLQFKRIDALHHHSAEQIETSFELWWESGPKLTVQRALVKKAAEDNDMEVPADLDNNELVGLIRPFLRDLEARARHLALHAHMGGSDTELMKRMPVFGGLRQQVVRGNEKHQEWIESEKNTLLQFGLDPKLIEQHFSPTGQ